MMETFLRAGLRIAEYDLEFADEFHNRTGRYFQKKIEAFKARADSHPDAYWEQDVGGITRGELASEELRELESFAEMNNRFGVLAVFAAFERLVQRIHQDMMNQNLIHDRRFKKVYLTFDESKDSLAKIGIYVTKAPFDWSNLRKLQTLRNAIAHQDGWVTDENINKLRSYRYKVGQRIEITDSSFGDSMNLVKQSCSQLVKGYSVALSRITNRSHRKTVSLLAAVSLVAVYIVGRAALRSL
jgi:hypothetical protein